MNSNKLQRYTALAAIGALGVAVPAFAHGGHGPGHDTPSMSGTDTTSTEVEHHGHGHGPGEDHGRGHGKARNAIFRGTVASVGANQATVNVTGGNNRARQFKGQTVSFDLTKARIRVKDVNNDGKRDLADVAVGDPVLVQASLTKDAAQPFPARKFEDKKPRSGKGEDEHHTSTTPTTTSTTTTSTTSTTG